MFDPASVDAKVRISDPRSRANSDFMAGRVQDQFEVIDEPKDGASALCMKEVGFELNDLATFPAANNVSRFFEGRLRRSRDLDRRDGVHFILSIATDTVGRGGALTEDAGHFKSVLGLAGPAAEDHQTPKDGQQKHSDETPSFGVGRLALMQDVHSRFP